MSDPKTLSTADAPTYPPRKGMDAGEIAACVGAILAAATLEERVAMMSGKGFFRAFKEDKGVWAARPYRAGAGCERLGVPALYFTDGPRGVCRGNSTCFPVTMARGASFDTDLERRIGEAMAKEVRAQGCNLSGAVCVNLLRHPGWGRAQETYGEDPHHVGEMGTALALGLQAHNVIATVKHLAVNSIENSRFKVDVQVDEDVLHEVYLPHFKRIVQAGCASVMSAYNKLNGEYCGENRDLLTDILREDWGFEGFVHSDWIMGVYKVHGASAGLDVENPEPRVFGDNLVAAVKAGHVAEADIDRACRRILTTLYRFASAEDPLPEYGMELVASPAHVALAEEAALKSAVLLKNDGVLPLSEGARVGVGGRLSGMENTGDHGSSRVRPPHVVTARAGLEARGAVFLGDEAEIDALTAAAREMDVPVLVVGYTRVEEGEYIPGDMTLGTDSAGAADGESREGIGGDRTDLRLPSQQVEMIRAVAAANAKTVVVLVAGSAVLIDEWSGEVAGVIQTFYSGMEGGTALAKLIHGDVSPSGKLPFTVMAREADYPDFDPTADAVRYGRFHGYTLADREGHLPAYPFGFGLSYTTFSLRAARMERVQDGVRGSVAVTNTGARAGAEVVQLYVAMPGPETTTPKQVLQGFRRVELEPGETKIVDFAVTAEALRRWDSATGSWRDVAGRYGFSFARSSRDDEVKTVWVEL